MLFNSPIFIFIFLPITLIGFFALCSLGRHRAIVWWLVLASFVFYGYWNPIYLVLLGVSLVVNFQLGSILARSPERKPMLLAFGVALNLGNIGYFKYANFLVDNVNAVAHTTFSMGDIVLPLGISFYTFQQIAYLVDSYRKQTDQYDFLNYCLFGTFFPHLNAGPIMHHREMMPQFADPKTFRFDSWNLATGISIFAVGLFKKVVLADGIAPFANEVFGMAEDPAASITFFTAWGGALAYTFQLYFDFSGYSDMAFGLARMMGIVIPINFNSPYKAHSITEFWRRWHISLSRFLRDYLYVPLGGNRKGEGRRYVNLMATMLLGGLWHGASWNFVLWGGLHGLYLVINNAWGALGFSGPRDPRFARVYRAACVAFTFIVVVLAWVIFRAPTLNGARSMYSALFGFNGAVMPESFLGFLNTLGIGTLIDQLGVTFEGAWQQNSIGRLFFLFGLGAVALFAPNVIDLFNLADTKLRRPWTWMRFDTNYRWAAFSALILGVSVVLVLSQRVSEFLYYVF